MSEERMSRKELHRPDPIEVWLYAAADFIYKKQQWFVAGAIAVVVIIIGVYLGYEYYQSQQNEQANIFHDGQKKVQDATDSLNTEKSQEAISALEEFVTTYPNQVNSPAAWMHLGKLHAQQNAWVAAEEAYMKVIENSKVQPIVVNSAKISLAAVYENQGKWDDARQMIEKVEGDNWRDIRWKTLARIEMAQGQFSEAKSYLEKIVEETPDSPFKQDAEAILLTLNQ